MVTIFFPSLIEAFLLVSALSIDAFVSSFAYGTDKIKIPFRSVFIINIICTLLLGVSLLVGQVARTIIPSEFTSALCFLILFALAFMKLFDFLIKQWIQKSKFIIPKVSFHIMDFHFLLQVYCDTTRADIDESKTLSARESMALAIALSVDGLAAGFGAGLTNSNLAEILTLSFITGMVAVMLGCLVGNKVAKKTDLNVSWISGAVLLLLAFSKIF